MGALAAVGAVVLIVIILWDSFETIVLPRRVTHQLRLSRAFLRAVWKLWSATARRMSVGSEPEDYSRRETFLSFYGPLALLLLLILWGVALIIGFAMLLWALGSALDIPEGPAGFTVTLYVSGTNFFTLGLGDVVPRTSLARAITVVEAGTGFGFLALVIGYLPVLYQAFSRREMHVSLLDARAGSPPTAVEFLRRLDPDERGAALSLFLRDWEHWSAEVLESHLSYPVLAFFRSQHENQSWLAALTMIMDLCALVIVGLDGLPSRQARLAFAMARHAVVDLSQIFGVAPRAPYTDRLPPAGLVQLRAALMEAGFQPRAGPSADEQLVALRRMYEPYVTALSDHLLMPLPSWLPAASVIDDWQTSAWEQVAEIPHSER